MNNDCLHSVHIRGAYTFQILYERSQVHLISAVFGVLDFLKKLFEFNRLIVINFWRLIDHKNFNQYQH